MSLAKTMRRAFARTENQKPLTKRQGKHLKKLIHEYATAFGDYRYQEAVQEEYGGANSENEVDRTEAALKKYIDRIAEKE